MKSTISSDRTRLIICADETERAILRGLEEIQSDQAMYDFFESLVCNSEFQFVSSENTGDLTSAPILAILSTPEFKRHNLATVQNRLNILCSADTHGLMVARVVERWAFMDYQVRSVLEDLRDRGEVIFIGGKI